MEVTLSIAEAAVNWRLLSKAIWMELWERQREKTNTLSITSEGRESWVNSEHLHSNPVSFNPTE